MVRRLIVGISFVARVSVVVGVSTKEGVAVATRVRVCEDELDPEEKRWRMDAGAKQFGKTWFQVDCETTGRVGHARGPSLRVATVVWQNKQHGTGNQP